MGYCPGGAGIKVGTTAPIGFCAVVVAVQAGGAACAIGIRQAADRPQTVRTIGKGARESRIRKG
ncbi:hypothetical protein D3C73_1269080 [compost metagenome]